MILRCTCEHKYQDGEYGCGNRVCNECKGQPPHYRCTVCKKEHTPQSNKPKETK